MHWLIAFCREISASVCCRWMETGPSGSKDGKGRFFSLKCSLTDFTLSVIALARLSICEFVDMLGIRTVTIERVTSDCGSM